MNARFKPFDARLAAWLVKPLAGTRIEPNHLTCARLLTGLAGAWLFAFQYAALPASLLFVLSNFLDHTDGELARLSGKQSRFGHNFDLLADALVTSLLFVSLGMAQAPKIGAVAVWLGALAGIAVATIFHLRNKLENVHGKQATRQPRWLGFEAEDVLYLLPLVVLADSLAGFLYAAGVGAPMALLLVIAHQRTIERGGKVARP